MKKDSDERKYYFSTAKHAHDIDFYNNRLQNIVDEAYSKEEGSAGLILAQKYGYDFIDALNDFITGQLDDVWNAVTYNSDGRVSILTGQEIGLAKKIAAWAEGQRSGASGKLDVGPAWDYAKRFIKTKSTKDSAKVTYYDPGNYSGRMEESYPEEIEIEVRSDLTNEELDPEEVWMSYDGAHCSFDEAVDLFWKDCTRAIDPKEYNKAVEWMKANDWDESWFKGDPIEIRYIPEMEEYVFKDSDALDMEYYLEHTGFTYVPYDDLVKEAWDNYNNG